MKNRSVASIFVGWNKRSAAGCFLAASMAFGAVYCPGLRAESLREAVFQTLTTHPVILAAKAAERRSQYAVTEARAGYFPSLDISGEAGIGSVENSTTRARAEIEEDLDDRQENNPYGYSVRLSQELFSGFSTMYSSRSASFRNNSAQSDFIAANETMALKAAEVYLGVIRAQKVLQLSGENVRDHQEMLDKVTELADGGKGNYGDVSQARSRLAQAQERMVQLEGQIEDARTRYFEVVGVMPEELEDPVTENLVLPETMMDAVSFALQSSPRLQAAEYASQSREVDVKVETSSFYPTVSVELSANGDWDANGFEERTLDNRAMLVLRYNLLNGGADYSARKQALESAIEAKQKMFEIKRNIEKQTAIDYQSYLTATDSLAYLKSREQASVDALANYKQQYELSRRSLLDVLDVINELFQARVAVLDGQLAVDFSKYKVLADLGTLTEALEVDTTATKTASAPEA